MFLVQCAHTTNAVCCFIFLKIIYLYFFAAEFRATALMCKWHVQRVEEYIHYQTTVYNCRFMTCDCMVKLKIIMCKYNYVCVCAFVSWRLIELNTIQKSHLVEYAPLSRISEARSWQQYIDRVLVQPCNRATFWREINVWCGWFLFPILGGNLKPTVQKEELIIP